MRVSDFDFELPPERIALRPAIPRESAKLLVVGDGFGDFTVSDLPSQLRAAMCWFSTIRKSFRRP